MRQVVNAVLCVVVGGIQWRMLPNEYPKWQSVYGYVRTWRDYHTWERIHDTLRAEVRRQAGRYKQPTAGCLDSQSVKTTAVPGSRGYDKGKQVNGRKQHVLVDTLGLLMAVIVRVASVQDRDGARLLLTRLGGACKKLRLVWVDGAYRGQLLDWVAEHCRCRLRVVMRSDDQTGFAVLPRRWVVERTFAWLNQARRLSKDYEGLVSTSEALVHIVMIRLMVRRLAHT